jgi:hypothetical protein
MVKTVISLAESLLSSKPKIATPQHQHDQDHSPKYKPRSNAKRQPVEQWDQTFVICNPWIGM